MITENLARRQFWGWLSAYDAGLKEQPEAVYHALKSSRRSRRIVESVL
jgi:hypothetical protein